MAEDNALKRGPLRRIVHIDHMKHTMAEDHALKPASEILQSLHALLLGPEEDIGTLPLAQVQTELQAEGIDPTPLLKRVRERLVHMRQGTDVVSHGPLGMEREAQPKETRPMFRRFTKRARKVVTVLAREEAERYHHEYLGTEHLLLGILTDGGGTAITVLQQAGLSTEQIRMEVERHLPRHTRALSVDHIPYTPRAKRALEYGVEEAQLMEHTSIGTEHILLGLLKEKEGMAAKVLHALGMRLVETREQIAIRSALTAANKTFMEAFRQGDAAAVAATYTANGQALPPQSDSITGRSAIQAFWQGVLERGIKAAQRETVELENHGDTAIEVGKYTLQGEGGQTLDTGKYVVTWKHESGQWKWHRDIWNSSVPAPGQ